MKNFWCEKCNFRWQCEKSQTICHSQCPNCGERHDIRLTMPIEEARERGLLDGEPELSKCCSVPIINGRCSTCQENV